MKNNQSEHLNIPSNETVIVLHGLFRTAFSMRKIARELKSDYRVVINNYPSRKNNIQALAELAIKPALEGCKGSDKVHFVTHSLGGILVRQFLLQNKIENLGHVVMLAPPNHGSEIVDRFQSFGLSNWAFDKVNGPAGAQLGTLKGHLPKTLGPVDFSLGVIAGNVSFNPFLSSMLQGDDDGKVSVESSKIDGMRDHLVMPVSHTYMMSNDAVIKQIKCFLKDGAFAR